MGKFTCSLNSLSSTANRIHHNTLVSVLPMYVPVFRPFSDTLVSSFGMEILKLNCTARQRNEPKRVEQVKTVKGGYQSNFHNCEHASKVYKCLTHWSAYVSKQAPELVKRVRNLPRSGGLLEFLTLREIHTSLCRNKKKTRPSVKTRSIFRGITIARLSGCHEHKNNTSTLCGNLFQRFVLLRLSRLRGDCSKRWRHPSGQRQS